MTAGREAWFRQLHWQILVGVVVGVGVGLSLGVTAVPYYDWLGELFLRALKMVVVPLIVSSMIVGIARIGNPREVGWLGGRALLYYVFTSALAIGTGLLLLNLFQPGAGVTLDLGAAPATLHTDHSFRDTLLGIVPENPVGAAAAFAMKSGASAGLVGVIFFCVVFGLGLAALPETKRRPVLGFFEGVFDVMIKITDAVIRLAPLGVAALVGKVAAENSDPKVLGDLAVYMGTVIGALGLHFFVTIPLLVFLLARRDPYAYMRQCGLALATAFTTASSNATLPVSLEVSEKKGGVDGRVGGFVLPLGATINMDGSAMFEGVAALFVAQAIGYDLSVGAQLLIFLTALLASVGAAGIPHASFVMMGVVFTAVGLPLEAVGTLFAVDRLLTMCRTATNIWSDLAGAAIIDAAHRRREARKGS